MMLLLRISIFLILIVLPITSYSFSINKLIIKGTAIPIIKNNKIDINNELSETDLRKKCATLLKKYHSLGFITAVINKIIIKRNGNVIVLIRDRIVSQIDFIGPEGYNSSLNKFFSSIFFNPLNINIIKKKIQHVNKSFNIKIYKISHENISHNSLRLIIYYKETDISGFKINIEHNPIYGVDSQVLYIWKTKKFSGNINASIAYDDDYNSKLISHSVVSHKIDTKHTLLYSLSAGTKREIYSAGSNKNNYYKENYFNAAFGYIILKKLSYFHIACDNRFYKLFEYENKSPEIYKLGLWGKLIFNTAPLLLDKSEALIINMDIKTGYDFYFNKIYVSGNIFASKGITPLYDIRWFYFKTGIGMFATNMNERLYKEYIFNNQYSLEKDNFISTQMKIYPTFGVHFDIYKGIVSFYPHFIYGLYLEKPKGFNSFAGVGGQVDLAINSFAIRLGYNQNVQKSVDSSFFYFSIYKK